MLDRLAVTQYEDVVAQVAHDTEVVGHQDQAQPVVDGELLQQVEDLHPHGDVERADRFVGHEQCGPRSDRACDGNALLLAAGELVRVAPPPLGVEPDCREHLDDPRVVVARHVEADERLTHDRRDGHAWIERRQRVLQHDLGLSPEPAQ